MKNVVLRGGTMVFRHLSLFPLSVAVFAFLQVAAVASENVNEDKAKDEHEEAAQNTIPEHFSHDGVVWHWAICGWIGVGIGGFSRGRRKQDIARGRAEKLPLGINSTLDKIWRLRESGVDGIRNCPIGALSAIVECSSPYV